MNGFYVLCFLILLGLITNAQDKILLRLPENFPQIEKDFYISNVFEKREITDNIGYIYSGEDNKEISIGIENGLIPSLKNYLNSILPADAEKTSIVLVINKISLKEKIIDSSDYLVSNIDIDFFNDNNNTLTKLYHCKTHNEISSSNVERELVYIFCATINECLKEFSDSDWKKLIYSAKNKIDESEISAEEKRAENKDKPQRSIDEIEASYKRIIRYHFNVFTGYSYWNLPVNGDISEQGREFMDDLKLGNIFGADACYFLTPHYGVGIRYSQIHHNSMDVNWLYRFDSINFYSLYKKDIKFRYVGAVLCGRTFIFNNKVMLTLNVSPGWIWYDEYFAFYVYYIETKENAFAINVGASVNVEISEGISIGIGASYDHARLEGVNFPYVQKKLSPTNNEINLDHMNVFFTLKVFR